MIGIYKITSPNNRIYIGQSRNIESRWYDYKNIKDIKKQYRIYNSLLKYGYESHTFEVIEECEFDNLNIRERYWQEFYEVIGPNGLNCVYVNTDDKPKIVSDITKNKLSIIRKQLYNDGVLCRKSPFKGRTHTEESKIINKEKHLGKKHSDETRLKMSNSRMGMKNGKLIKVINIETGEIYESVSDCSIKLNIPNTTLTRWLKNESKNKTNIRYYNEKNGSQ